MAAITSPMRISSRLSWSSRLCAADRDETVSMFVRSLRQRGQPAPQDLLQAAHDAADVGPKAVELHLQALLDVALEVEDERDLGVDVAARRVRAERDHPRLAGRREQAGDLGLEAAQHVGEVG